MAEDNTKTGMMQPLLKRKATGRYWAMASVSAEKPVVFVCFL